MKRRPSAVFTLFALLVLCLGAGGCANSTSDETLVHIETMPLSERVQSSSADRMALIDTRPQQDFIAGHLPGAINLRIEDFSRGRLPMLDRYSRIVVYGQNPASVTARALAKRLHTLGYDRVRVYDGGVDAWRAAGLPIERGSS